MLFSAALGVQPLTAQVDLQFSESKRFQQVGPTNSIFLGGNLNITVWDGNYATAGCAANGGFMIAGPDPLFCPNGTTALVVSGDINGDGMSDMSRFWSVVAISRTQAIEPFVAHRLSLYSSPSPYLPKPLTGFQDTSLQLFYNVLNPPSSRYRVTRYSLNRPYAAGDSELKRMRREIQQGTYTFMVPRLNPDPLPPGYPQVDFALPVNHDPPLEAWPGKGVVPTINDWVLQNDANWVAGRIEIDPRFFFRFNWRGFNGGTVRLGDTTLFSIVDPDPTRPDKLWPNPHPVLPPPLGPLPAPNPSPPPMIVYPPYPGNAYDPYQVELGVTTPPVQRAPQLLANPSTGIELPPLSTLSTLGYTFQPGHQLRGIVDFRRNAATSAVARDTSRRLFEWDILLVDTYQGYKVLDFSPDPLLAPSQPPFPLGTPESQMAPGFDFDGDGWTNLEEYALQTNPADAGSSPAITPVIGGDSKIMLEIAKRPNVRNVRYSIQYTYDMVNWTTITPADPSVYVIEVDDATTLRVRSVNTSPPESSSLRVRITGS